MRWMWRRMRKWLGRSVERTGTSFVPSWKQRWWKKPTSFWSRKKRRLKMKVTSWRCSMTSGSGSSAAREAGLYAGSDREFKGLFFCYICPEFFFFNNFLYIYISFILLSPFALATHRSTDVCLLYFLLLSLFWCSKYFLVYLLLTSVPIWWHILGWGYFFSNSTASCPQTYIFQFM